MTVSNIAALFKRSDKMWSWCFFFVVSWNSRHHLWGNASHSQILRIFIHIQLLFRHQLFTWLSNWMHLLFLSACFLPLSAHLTPFFVLLMPLKSISLHVYHKIFLIELNLKKYFLPIFTQNRIHCSRFLSTRTWTTPSTT